MAVRSEGRHAIVRAKLAQAIQDSRLPIKVFSSWVLGRCDRTAQRYLAGDPIPNDTANWIQRIEHVHHDGDRIFLVLRWEKRNYRWNRLDIMGRRAKYYAEHEKATAEGKTL